MAIFVALIFQVLFVLFAMAINVALVVHDKINLQNAVDLAAYYAAQKQAELLNVIAHENYMIRQSWKLLAFRYRVLGTFGIDEGAETHPAVLTQAGLDREYAGWLVAPGMNDRAPAVCVTNGKSWQNVAIEQNICKKQNNIIPALPDLPVVAAFPWNFSFSSISRQLKKQVDLNCSTDGAYNLWFAMVSLTAFRYDQRNRKQVIQALANNLGQHDFIDLDGSPVSEGTLQTFKKNLTFTNHESQVSFKMMNSLAGRRPEEWLSEIKISPTLMYLDPRNVRDCDPQIVSIEQGPDRPAAETHFQTLPGANELEVWRNDKFLQGNDYQFSLGVEKNPWLLAYVGVQAETAPRQIFFPIGESVRLRARAYAKPFGGRIGPWYAKRWPRGALESAGGGEAKVDRLLPTRTQAGGLMDLKSDATRLPNYSRYPGDDLGLKSNLSLGALKGLGGQRIFNFAYYENAWQNMQEGGAVNDPMAFDVDAADPNDNIARKFEIAAVAPDLFDMAYYSVEPNFAAVYLPKLRQNRSKLGISGSVPIRGDLGSVPMRNLDLSVNEQISLAAQFLRNEVYFYAREKKHLLTGWTSGDQVFEYSQFPTTRFGQCESPDDSDEFPKIPGSCVAGGGRTGYSVKIMARDYFFSADLPLGGPNEAAGSILNPPPDEDGW